MVSCLDLFVQLCRGEGGALQTNVTGGCGEHSQCSSHTASAPLTGVCSPRLHCSGSRLLYREWALRCVRFQFSGIPQKRGLGWACVLCLPCPSSSGSPELDESLHSPGVQCAFSPTLRSQPQFLMHRLGAPCVCSGGLVSSRDPPSGCQPSRISESLWLETGRLFAVW